MRGDGLTFLELEVDKLSNQESLVADNLPFRNLQASFKGILLVSYSIHGGIRCQPLITYGLAIELLLIFSRHEPGFITSHFIGA